MRLRHIRIWPLLRETGRKWNDDNCVRLGASLSYYTLFSLFPLILVVLTIIRLLFLNSDGARDAILDALGSVTGGFRDDFVKALDAAIQSRRTSGIVGSITLVLGASWVFGELVSAFNIMWQVEAKGGGGPLEFIRSTFFSFALVLSGAFLLLVSMIISAVLTTFGTFIDGYYGGLVVWRILQLAVNLGVLTIIFALLFKYLPRTRVAWGDVWLGAGLTALLWTLLQSAIAFYIALNRYKDYGSIGAIIALVVWVYLSSQVVFLGGEFTNVFARSYGSRFRAPPSPSAPSIVPPRVAALAVEPNRERIVSGATGVTLGVLGALGLALVALMLGTTRALRRFWSR